jgi:secreted trypsin-like serine protease
MRDAVGSRKTVVIILHIEMKNPFFFTNYLPDSTGKSLVVMIGGWLLLTGREILRDILTVLVKLRRIR